MIPRPAKPDVTHNLSRLVNLTFDHDASDGLVLSGNLYFREIHTRTLNGDINDDSLTESVYQPNAAERAALAAGGHARVPPSGGEAADTPCPSYMCIPNPVL